jgi:hypothetical protein
MATSYIGADVDCKTTVLAVRRGTKEVAGYRVPTTIPALREVLEGIRGPKVLTLEEGPMADWLYRNLRGSVKDLIVCDPRRNRLIVGDGDKTNAIDAGKLAELLQGGNVRRVHHPETQERVELKQWVSLYEDRVKEAVRQVNKIRARCRMYGVYPVRGFLSNAKAREGWLRKLESAALAGQLRVLWIGYEAAATQVDRCRKELGRRAKGEPIVGRWERLPGVGLIRAMVLLAYLDTPWRFSGHGRRWKYCGVGLERNASGTDRHGRDKPGRLRVCQACNHRIKNAVVGATISAIGRGGNKFSDLYERLVRKGVHAGNARRAAARKLVDTLFGMWKTGSGFCPELA